MPDFCVICLEDIDQNVRFLRCSHSFHSDCINKWIKEKKECPICRVSIEEKTEHIPVLPSYTNYRSNFETILATGIFALSTMIAKHPMHDIKYSPYTNLIEIVGRSFTRRVISNSYSAIHRYMSQSMEEPVQQTSTSERLEKTKLLIRRLIEKNVDLNEFPLEDVESLDDYSLNFLYIKLLEKKDAYNINSANPI